MPPYQTAGIARAILVRCVNCNGGVITSHLTLDRQNCSALSKIMVKVYPNGIVESEDLRVAVDNTFPGWSVSKVLPN